MYYNIIINILFHTTHQGYACCLNPHHSFSVDVNDFPLTTHQSYCTLSITASYRSDTYTVAPERLSHFPPLVLLLQGQATVLDILLVHTRCFDTLDMEFVADIQDLLAESAPVRPLGYGTAGFRAKATEIPGAVIRVGIISSLISRSSNSQCVGIMITASHNMEEDNGVKIADTDGGMLAQSWEKPIEDIANCTDPTQALNLIQDLITRLEISSQGSAHVVIGRDTRPSSFDLFTKACRGIEALGGTIHDIGTVTTPQLHFVVKRMNEELKSNPGQFPIASVSLESYYSTLCKGYHDLKGTASNPTPVHIVVDAANGIGGRSLGRLNYLMQQAYPDTIEMDIRNDVGDGSVNDGCGAELVQKGQTPPLSVSSEEDVNKNMCSFDGDADRIVFHGFSNSGGTSETHWFLADGDKIACLMATILKNEFVAAEILSDDGTPKDGGVKLGVVQTAYANGSSTHFLEKIKIPVVFAKTGVKYLHRRAEECFDVAIYFEANGHGTVLFNEKFQALVAGWGNNSDIVDGVSPRIGMARIRILVY